MNPSHGSGDSGDPGPSSDAVTAKKWLALVRKLPCFGGNNENKAHTHWYRGGRWALPGPVQLRARRLRRQLRASPGQVIAFLMHRFLIKEQTFICLPSLPLISELVLEGAGVKPTFSEDLCVPARNRDIIMSP